MKIKTNQKNEETKNALRNALIQKIDMALEAKEPDMDAVDLCTKLLDALEQGSCQPGGHRMRQELARIAQEIDYIPQAHTMVQTKPMTVRRAVIGAAAVFLCLLLLPISVILLRGGNQTMSGQTSTETSPAAAETAEPAVTADGVTFLRGNSMTQYDDFSVCMDTELPEFYYPTVFPENMQPISVTVTEEDDDVVCAAIGFGDALNGIAIYPWDDERNTAAKENGYELGFLQNWIDDTSFLLLEAADSYDGDVYRLFVHIDDLVYAFSAADEASAHAMVESLRRADTDHIHAWESCIIEIPREEDSTAGERRVQKSCSLCETDDSTLPMHIDTDGRLQGNPQ